MATWLERHGTLIAGDGAAGKVYILKIQTSTTTVSGKETHWRILIVDSNSENRDLCGDILKADGYSASSVENINEAFMLLRQSSVDLVLTTVGEAGIDGLALLARVKELYPDVCVLVMSASNAIEYSLEALRRGAMDFIAKPFAPEDLSRLVRGCIKTIRAEREDAFQAQARSILELSRVLADQMDPQVLPVRALEIACKSFESDSAILFAAPNDGEPLTVLAQSGRSLTRWGQSEHLRVHSNAALREGKTQLAVDPSGMDCYAYAPLRLGKKSNAVLCLRRTGGPWFHEKSTALLEIFATHLAAAMEASRLHDAAARQVEELEQLAAESRALSLTTDHEILIDRLLNSAERIAESDICAVMTAEGDSLELRTKPELLQDSPLREAVRSKMLSLLAPERLPHAPAHAAAQRMKCVISAPLRAEGLVFGIVAVFSRLSEGFPLSAAQRLNLLAETASVSMANANTLTQVSLVYNEAIDLLARMADSRCPHGAGHSSQVRTLASELAQAMRIRGRELYRIEDGALLHDIGKLRVPDEVLRKPGNLTDEEFALVSAHPIYGAAMLENAQHLRDLVPLVRHHHEWFDGTGYPDRLKGNEIPLGARIVSVCDVFDALVSHRVYRRAMSVEETCRTIADGSGQQFDPAVVKTFLALPLKDMIQH